MATYAKPYISGLRLTFHEYVAPQQRRNAAGQVVAVIGKQKPGLNVDVDLYLTPTKNVGRQPYAFSDKPQAAVPGVHAGLPAFSDLVSDQLKTALLAEFGAVIDANLPEYEDESAEAKAVGVRIYPRINALQVALPYEPAKAAERMFAFVVGLYEDKDYTRQIVDADFVVLFVEDAFIARQFNVNVEDLAPAALAALRAENTVYSLKEFLARENVKLAIGGLSQALFTCLKGSVAQWADIDVAELMERFKGTFEGMAG